MDEAQKELDRGATTRGTEDDEDDEGEEHAGDLLDTAEADAGTGGPAAGTNGKTPDGSLLDQPMVTSPTGQKSSAASIKSTGSGVEKDTMFER